MTYTEFNEKYKEYIKEGFDGLEIDYPAITGYLVGIMEELILIPGFKFSQIKSKFGTARFYNNLDEIVPTLGRILEHEIEERINFLLRVEREIESRKQ